MKARTDAIFEALRAQARAARAVFFACGGAVYRVDDGGIVPASDIVDALHKLQSALATLRAISKRIDAGSGSAHWTAREHDKIEALLSTVQS